MKPYLDTEDTFYFNYEELIKASKITTNLAELKAELEPKQKPKKDYAGIGAVIFTFTVMSIVIGLSIFTAWQIAYGQTNNLTGTLDFSNYFLDMNIKYPENWVYSEYNSFLSSDDYSAVFVPSSEVSFLKNMTASPPDVYVQIAKQRDLPYKNMPLDLYFDYAKKLKISQGFNITNTGKTILSDGTQTYEMDVSNNTPPVKMIVVLMNKNPESYYFVYNAPPEKFNTYLPIAQQMFKNLSFN